MSCEPFNVTCKVSCIFPFSVSSLSTTQAVSVERLCLLVADTHHTALNKTRVQFSVCNDSGAFRQEASVGSRMHHITCVIWSCRHALMKFERIISWICNSFKELWLTILIDWFTHCSQHHSQSIWTWTNIHFFFNWKVFHLFLQQRLRRTETSAGEGSSRKASCQWNQSLYSSNWGNQGWYLIKTNMQFYN